MTRSVNKVLTPVIAILVFLGIILFGGLLTFRYLGNP